VKASAVYIVNEKGISSARIEVQSINATSPTIVAIPLPFSAEKYIPQKSNILGILNRENYALALITIEPTKPKVSFEVKIDSLSLLKNGVRISQSPLGAALIIPKLGPTIHNELKGLLPVTDLIIVSQFITIEAEFTGGFEIFDSAGGTASIKTHSTQIVKLDPSPNGLTYYKYFKAPGTAFDEYVEKGIVRSIIVLLGLLVTFMAPGFLPEQLIGKIFIIMVTLILSALGIRWWFASSTRESISSAIADTVAVVIYLIGMTIVWFLRKNTGNQPAQQPH